MITKQFSANKANSYSSHILAKAHFTWRETSNTVLNREKREAFCNKGVGRREVGSVAKGEASSVFF